MAYKFNYDYSKTLWMKMFLATPENDINNFAFFNEYL